MVDESERGIYAIKNTKNGKCYVGSTKDAFKKRWKNHRNTLAAGQHHSVKLQRAYVKYGQAAFDYLILEIVEDENRLVEREQFWMEKLDCVKTGYNVAPTARSSLGVKWTEESRQNMSAMRAEISIPPEHHAAMAEGRRNSPKWRHAVAKVHQGNIGRNHTDGAKLAIGKASKLRWQNPDYKENHSAKMTDYKHNDEIRAKISKGKRGMVFTEAHKLNLSISHRGHEPTPEARTNMSLAQQRRREREHALKALSYGLPEDAK